MVRRSKGHKYSEKYFHFGSQSEGTTTAGMGSDIDILRYSPVFKVISREDMKEETGLDQYLIIKDNQTLPQHCRLKVLGAVDDGHFEYAKDSFGNVCLKNSYFEKFFQDQLNISGDMMIRHGPARSFTEEIDVVMTLFCPELPDECKEMFRRPRPGHRPRPEVIEACKKEGVFLGAVGHPHSSQKDIEWRFSTSTMERLVMFDLGMVHIRVYVSLKFLRKRFFKPAFGDRLSSFHMKTALFYTVETYQEEIWTDFNIIECIKCCLETLLEWAKNEYCPHYTISDVNLFVGKIKPCEMPKLVSLVSEIIENLQSCLFHIDCDEVGLKLTEACGFYIPRRYNTSVTDLNKTVYDTLFRANFLTDVRSILNINNEKLNRINFEESIALLQKYFADVQEEISQFDHHVSLVNEATECILPFMYSTFATLLFVSQGALTDPISTLYNMSFHSDMTSSKLKFASALYAMGKPEEAAKIVKHVELVYDEIGPCFQDCLCGRLYKEPSDEFMQKVPERSNNELLQARVALCVMFTRHESRALPPHMVFEMYRTVSQRDKSARHISRDVWMDLAVVESYPFMCYLQCLVFNKLKLHKEEVAALDMFWKYNNNNGCVEIGLYLFI